MNLDEKKLDEIKQRSALAHKYICELAAGKHRWNMCIPPQPDDSDMALQAPIDDIKFLLEKIKRLEKAVELMRSSAKISIDYSAENCDCGSEGNPELREDHFCDCCANSYAFQDILADVDAILKEGKE